VAKITGKVEEDDGEQEEEKKEDGEDGEDREKEEAKGKGGEETQPAEMRIEMVKQAVSFLLNQAVQMEIPQRLHFLKDNKVMACHPG
jgi:hypothetical protein